MEDHFENYNVKELGCLNCGKVQEMKVFASVKNDSKYETAVCPDCVTSEESKMERSMR
ncbi:hypothetical protein [Sebaldella sp. S0638]|uniref:hypothetical protein n=1 Tax=Sebaldella sp. S0638 TaxID=2957809 RepID=UPI00209C9511|nr:hypothetical protein [Sebaldella sp. S0638]MCP1223801.1 hypothetical protein [Sebaldella sp. S0638]